MVAKKDGSVRLIIYARPDKSRPPHTRRCSSDTLSSIESTEATSRIFGEQMSISDVFVDLSLADVDNCFRHIHIRERLRRYFAFPGVLSARELGIVGTIFRGAPLVAESQVHSGCASLPMGFGWRLYFCAEDKRKADVGGRGFRPFHIGQWHGQSNLN